MADTIMVQRANVILEISEQEQDKYLAQGYDILDDSGNVVKKSIPTDIGRLRVAYHEALEEIEKLKAEVEKLTAQVKEKESEAVQVKEKEPEAEPSKPKRKSTKTKTEE